MARPQLLNQLGAFRISWFSLPPVTSFASSASAGAEDWLRDLLDEARRGTLPGLVRTVATFADAVIEFLRYAEHDRALKPSTLRGYRSILNAYLLPAFGNRRLEEITSADIEAWRRQLLSMIRRGWRGTRPARLSPPLQ